MMRTSAAVLGIVGIFSLAVAAACGAMTTSATDPVDGGAEPGGACSTNATCPDTSPICNRVTRRCEACTATTQCSDGLQCIAGQCSPCTKNSMCGDGLVCLFGRCGACQHSTQCDPSEVCVNGACRAGPGGVPAPPLDAGLPGCNSGYIGVVGPVGSSWQGSFGLDSGVQGKQAGDEACNAAFAGSHACTWEEAKASDVCGKLAALKQTTTTAWLHRTSPEVATSTAFVDDGASQPGAPSPAARCGDWQSTTNDNADGEWIEFGNGAMKAHLDGNTAPDAAAPGVLDCAGVSRLVLCCR